MSLTPARYNFTIYQGATFVKRIIYQIDSIVQPLTDYTASLPIKDAPGGTTLLTLDTGSNGGITLGGEAGFIDLNIPDTETANLTWDTGTYELFITDTNADRTDVLLRGAFRVVEF